MVTRLKLVTSLDNVVPLTYSKTALLINIVMFSINVVVIFVSAPECGKRTFESGVFVDLFHQSERNRPKEEAKGNLKTKKTEGGERRC